MFKLKQGGVLLVIFGLLLAGISSQVMAKKIVKTWEVSGLMGPESVVHDSKRGVLYVSNVNGGPLDVDENGFISKISLKGEVETLRWVEGLSAPKGMQINGDTLYVSDINQLVVIDIDTGSVRKRYMIPEAKFFNDIAIDQSGNVYVSDMLDNAIYRLNKDDFSVWIRSDALEAPNGLHVEGNDLIVASWGKLSKGFATSVPGHLKVVSLTEKRIKSLGSGMPVGNLDGLELDGEGGYYVTDWMAGKLLLLNKSGDAVELLGLKQGSADHEFIKEMGLLLIPMMNDNQVTGYRVTP